MIHPLVKPHYLQRLVYVRLRQRRRPSLQEPGRTPTATRHGQADGHAEPRPTSGRGSLPDVRGRRCPRPSPGGRHAGRARPEADDLELCCPDVREVVPSSMIDADLGVQMATFLKPAAHPRTLLELVRWLETHPAAEVSIEVQQGNFLARVFAPCQKTPRNRSPHDQRPRFAP